MTRPAPSRQFLVLLTLLALLASACAGQREQPEEEGSQRTEAENEQHFEEGEPTELTVAPAAPGLPFLPLFVARQEGFFADRELTVEVVEARGAEAVAAVESGQADVVMTLPELVIGPRARGSSLTLIGTTVNENLFGLYVTEDIEDVEDLKDEQVGIHVEGTATELHLRWLLDEEGAGADKSTFVSSGGPPARLAALREGQISGGLLLPEFGVPAERAGLKRLVDLAEFDTGYPIGVIAANEETLQNQAEAMERFMAAITEATQFIVDNPEAAIDISAEHLDGNRDVLADAYDATKKGYATDGAIPREGLEWALDQMRRYGDFEDLPAVDEIYDASFLPSG